MVGVAICSNSERTIGTCKNHAVLRHSNARADLDAGT